MYASGEWKYFCSVSCFLPFYGVQLLEKQILYYKTRPIFDRVSSPNELNMKSQKSSPFFKMKEKRGGIPIHFNI